VIALASVGVLVLYARGVRRLRCVGAEWSTWREASVIAGLALCALGAAGPFGSRFSGHVVEHVLLGMAGPALVAAGMPLTLAFRASSRVSRTRLRRVLRSRPMTVLIHPVVVLAFAVLAPWIVWLTPLNDWQLRSEPVHAIVHLHLFVSGLLFAIAILGLDHSAWRRSHAGRLLAASLALPLHTLLGLVILSASTPYLNRGMAPSAGLSDQRFGAALLWLVGDGLATVALLVIGLQWLDAERRAEARIGDESPDIATTRPGAATGAPVSG
jgi:cytochrome c oxidase assembly factor CtaG